MKSFCIYEWRSWHRFLLPMIFPEATRLQARLGETSSDVLERLPSRIKTFLFNVNLTDTRRAPLRRSAFSRALRARGIRILNEHVTDISKRRVQEVCAEAGLNTTRATRAGDLNERLIVKTNPNYAGENEQRLTPDLRRKLGLASPNRWIRRHDGYLIQRRSQVDDAHWRSRQLIVERFIENRRHIFYRAHKVGDRMIVSRMVNPAGIKKMLHHIPRTNWNLHLPSLEPVEGPRPAPVHVIQAAARFCTVFKLDAGSIDVLEDNQAECYVIDVNASPYWAETHYDNMLRFLAAGL